MKSIKFFALFSLFELGSPVKLQSKGLTLAQMMSKELQPTITGTSSRRHLQNSTILLSVTQACQQHLM